MLTEFALVDVQEKQELVNKIKILEDENIKLIHNSQPTGQIDYQKNLEEVEMSEAEKDAKISKLERQLNDETKEVNRLVEVIQKNERENAEKQTSKDESEIRKIKSENTTLKGLIETAETTNKELSEKNEKLINKVAEQQTIIINNQGKLEENKKKIDELIADLRKEKDTHERNKNS